METIQEDLLTTALRTVLGENTRLEIFVGGPVKVELAGTQSQIISQNKSVVYISKFPNLEGLFIKEKEDTRKIGRFLCDLTKDTFQCKGFFTSDELPRYGIKRNEVKMIFKSMNKEKRDGDLLVLYAYDYETAIKIDQFLRNYLNERISQVLQET